MNYRFKHNLINNIHLLTVPAFESKGGIAHGFTTRIGGVSEPPLDSMNLGFSCGDSTESVMRNYELAGDALGIDLSDVVAFQQVHGSDIYVATEKDAQKRPLSIMTGEYDGIITAIKNLPIATFHADCVPIFLFDPVCRVVGVVHAGWRGTVKKIAANAVNKMVSEFGCERENILAAIGPCIRSCCYEVGGEVVKQVSALSEVKADECVSIKNGRYHIDLSDINCKLLLHSGISGENITVCNECTCCNSDLYWSHRKTNGIRGCMAAVIMLY